MYGQRAFAVSKKTWNCGCGRIYSSHTSVSSSFLGSRLYCSNTARMNFQKTYVQINKNLRLFGPCFTSANKFSSSSNQLSRYLYRTDLPNSKRIIVKLGSAVITRQDECGLALGRLASIIEQACVLHNMGKQVLMVTSGAIAFGKQKLQQEIIMSMSMRQTISHRGENGKKYTEVDIIKMLNFLMDNIYVAFRDQVYQQTIDILMGVSYAPLLADLFFCSYEADFIQKEYQYSIIEPRACAAVGQSGLMSLYEAMFNQYGVKTAQVLITKPDFNQAESRKNLTGTLNELIGHNIIPILNANDAVAPPPELDSDLHGVISLKDNDSLAARLAVEIDADLMILMSDVNGLYTGPPRLDGSRLLHTFCPALDETNVTFGEKSRVGLGGMESKVRAATWAVEHGVSVVICNGHEDKAISNIVAGKNVGTFFTTARSTGTPVELQAMQARDGSRALQGLAPATRALIIQKLADLLLERQRDILDANRKDVDNAYENGLASQLISRLILNEKKLRTLHKGLKQIAEASHTVVGKVLRRTQLADNLKLKQISVPIGVLLVIFESRPDALPQVAALAIASANGLLLKGGKEALNSNMILHQLVQEALEPFVPKETIALISKREEIDDLLQMNEYIDLIIPRGSGELIRKIQEKSKGVPVLGHSEGICHMYIDKDADQNMAVKLVRDAKCDYPAACNAVETILLNKSLLKSPLFEAMCDVLKSDGVKIHSGPRLSNSLKFGPPQAVSLHKEYGSLEVTMEIVDDVNDAVCHINKYSSSHTDTIVTENIETAEKFLHDVDSACVFHNTSNRFADGYRFGLGAEVGISTSRIHARGPFGVEGLLTTKWVVHGQGHTADDFNRGKCEFLHQSLPLEEEDDIFHRSQDIAIEQ